MSQGQLAMSLPGDGDDIIAEKCEDDDDKVKDVKDGVNVLKMLNHSDQTILKVDINK